MPQTPDLFVVCSNCGSEVSGFVTECPYCGTRLRKRAPKLQPADQRAGRSRRVSDRVPRLGGLRAGEIPGIRPDVAHDPVVAITLAVACALGTIASAVFSPADVAVLGPLDGDWWRVASAPFFFENLWYAVAVILAVGLFGGLLERRHGPLAVVTVFCLCGIGGVGAAAALETIPFAMGANGAALGLLAAWAARPALELRRGGAPDTDLLGAGVIGLVVLMMPLAAPEASPTAGAVGLVAGIACGLVLARR